MSAVVDGPSAESKVIGKPCGDTFNFPNRNRCVGIFRRVLLYEIGRGCFVVVDSFLETLLRQIDWLERSGESVVNWDRIGGE